MLYGLSICSFCQSNEKPEEKTDFSLDEVVRWLPEESVKAALRDNLAPKYREGVFEHHSKAIEIIKDADPELAAKVVDEALQKELLLKRQADNSSTTSSPPSDPTSDPPTNPTPSSNPPSNPTSDQPSNPTSDEPSNPTSDTPSNPTSDAPSNPTTTTPDSNTPTTQDSNTPTTQSPAGECEIFSSQASIGLFDRSTVVDDEIARVREGVPS